MGTTGSTDVTCDPSSIYNLSQSPEDGLYDTTDLVLSLGVMPLILVLGLVGNLTFLFVITRVHRMRTVTNAYLTCLAVVDILFLVISVGDKIIQYAVSPVPGDQKYLGIPGCVILYFLQHLLNWLSIFIITLVSLEKYYGVCHPLKHIILHTFSRTWKMLASAVLLATVLSAVVIPAHCSLFYFCIIWPDDGEYDQHPDTIVNCGYLPGMEWMDELSNIMQTVPFFFALALNCLAYAKILLALHRRSAVTTTLNKNESNNIRARQQACMMLIANGIIFFVCVGPFQLYVLVYTILQSDINNSIELPGLATWLQVARIMLYLNSALNPYVYSVTNSVYRRSLRDAFSRRDSSRRRRYLSSATGCSQNGQSSRSVATDEMSMSRTETKLSLSKARSESSCVVCDA